MNNKEQLKAAEALLKDIKIPGKKDSMLNAAKHDHIQEVGILLDELLNEDTSMSEEIRNYNVKEFKVRYSKKFLKILD